MVSEGGESAVSSDEDGSDDVTSADDDVMSVDKSTHMTRLLGVASLVEFKSAKIDRYLSFEFLRVWRPKLTQ